MLLHYTAFNGFEEVSHNAPKTTPSLARLLIDRGAASDALAFDDPHGTPMCWALSSWFTHVSRVQTRLVDVYLDGGACIEGVLQDGAPLGHAIGFSYALAVEHLARRGAKTDHVLAAAALGNVEQLSQWLQSDGTFIPRSLEFARGEREETGRFSWPPPRDPDPFALALVTAATHGRVETVRWLLEHGATPDQAVSLDQTPLHFAAYVGHVPVVDLLLEHSARTDIRERQFGRTAAEWARETGEEAIAARLESLSSREG